MDLVTLTVATDKIELRCNSELSDAERTAAVEKISRFAEGRPDIRRVFVDIERDADLDQPILFIAKGQIQMDGPDLLASVADRDAWTAVTFLLDNFDRQLRRRSQNRVRVSLRAPKSQTVHA